MTGSDPLADENSAALARLDARVDGISREVGNLTHTVDRFVEKTDERFRNTDANAIASMQRVDDKLTAILTATNAEAKATAAASPNTSTGDWIRQNLAVIAVAAIGGFLTYVNTNIQGTINDQKQAIRDNVAAIVGTNAVVTKAATESSKALTDFESLVAKTLSDRSEATTKAIKDATTPLIPRPELEVHFANDKVEIDKKVEKDVLAADEKRYDSAIARFEKDVVSRQEHEQHWKQDAENYAVMSKRVEDAGRSAATSAVLQEQVKELSSQISEVRSRLLGSPKYLVGPGESISGKQ